jgi:FRG domain
MKGQWIGRTTGDQIGQIILNVDDLGNCFSGTAVTLPDDARMPSTVSAFQTADKNQNFSFTAATVPIDPSTFLPSRWEIVRDRYPDVKQHSNSAEVTGRYDQNVFEFEAITNIGVRLETQITKEPISELSRIPSKKKTWDQYKRYVSTLAEKKYLYRGQEYPWTLRTAFHRRGRYNLFRFLSDDVRLVQRRLTARTQHVFNLQIPDENGAFLNLAQHHGYPTPLLDWTYSPYVAAFFAFRHVSKNPKRNRYARIFIFDQQNWRSKLTQMQMLNTPGLHLSIMEFLAIENERLVPQQAATTITNIDDIERYVCGKEDEGHCKYLWAIDIAQSERPKVIQELAYMGITAGSMFPGLEGACEELREKMFDE